MNQASSKPRRATLIAVAAAILAWQILPAPEAWAAAVQTPARVYTGRT